MEINESKCEIARIGVKRSVPTTLCGLKNVSLLTDAICALGVHFTYNEKLFADRLNTLNKQPNSNLFFMFGACAHCRSMGKIVIFKSLAISTIIYVASLWSIQKDIMTILEKIHKEFIWDKKRPNIKHQSLIADYSKGGLKDIDVPSFT